MLMNGGQRKYSERSGAKGFCGITIPEEFGGQGLDILASGLIAQAMGRWNYAMALSWIAHENLCLTIYTETLTMSKK